MFFFKDSHISPVCSKSRIKWFYSFWTAMDQNIKSYYLHSPPLGRLLSPCGWGCQNVPQITRILTYQRLVFLVPKFGISWYTLLAYLKLFTLFLYGYKLLGLLKPGRDTLAKTVNMNILMKRIRPALITWQNVYRMLPRKS